MRALIFIVLLGSLFISCEKEIKMDIPEHKRKLTINAELYADSLIQVNVSKSIGILEDNDLASSVSDATIDLYENEIYLGQLTNLESGNYISTYKAQEHATYKIVVNHDVYSSVEAITRVPEKVRIEKIDTITKKSASRMGEQSTNLNYIVTFKDNLVEENYYCLQVKSSNYYFIYNNNQKADSILIGLVPTYILSDDLLVDNEAASGTFILFNDKLINGQSHALDLIITDFMYTDLYFELKSISKDLYFYLLSKKRNSRSKNPFTEPVLVYNNIENGFGVLGSSSTDVKYFKTANQYTGLK